MSKLADSFLKVVTSAVRVETVRAAIFSANVHVVIVLAIVRARR